MMSLEAQAGGRPLALRSLFCTEPRPSAEGLHNIEILKLSLQPMTYKLLLCNEVCTQFVLVSAEVLRPSGCGARRPANNASVFRQETADECPFAVGCGCG